MSFHYTDKENLTEANFQQLAAAESLQFYLVSAVGNCFYHAGELVAQLSAINLIKTPPAGPHDTRSAEERAFSALCTVIIQVSGDMSELFSTLIALLAQDVVELGFDSDRPGGAEALDAHLAIFCRLPAA